MNFRQMNNITHLKTHGYVVIPFLRKGGEYTDDFRETLARMPEFKDPRNMVEVGEHFVGGGFAALGNPSSFHNTFVRRIRQVAHTHVLKSVFEIELLQDKDLFFEQIIDRMMFRRAPKKPSREAWHRDESPNALEGDTIYGGWVNLDQTSQYFSGCPGTHLEVGNQNTGFAKIPKTEHARYNQLKKKIEIPPGHIFIFYERMAHEVLPTSRKGDMHRLFLGWRTTYSKEPLFTDLEERLQKRAVMQIKSGQTPPMYPSLYWSNWRNLLEAWSNNLVDNCTHKKSITSKSSDSYGDSYKVAHRYMESLEDYGLITDLCPPYTQDEVNILKPHRMKM